MVSKWKQKNGFWYSKVASYTDCPKKYELRYLHDTPYPGARSADLLFGSAIHASIEAMFEGENYLDTFDIYWNPLEEANDVVYGRFDWKYLKRCGATLLRKFNNRYLKKITPKFLEVRTKGKIGEHSFEGTPDVVGEYEGVPSVIDFKTSGYAYDKRKVLTAEQLTCYDHLMQDVYKAEQLVYIVLVKYNMSIQNPLILKLTDELRAGIIKNMEQWITDIKNVQTYKKNYNSCIKGKIVCPYFDVCHKGDSDE